MNVLGIAPLPRLVMKLIWIFALIAKLLDTLYIRVVLPMVKIIKTVLIDLKNHLRLLLQLALVVVTKPRYVTRKDAPNPAPDTKNANTEDPPPIDEHGQKSEHAPIGV